MSACAHDPSSIHFYEDCKPNSKLRASFVSYYKRKSTDAIHQMINTFLIEAIQVVS